MGIAAWSGCVLASALVLFSGFSMDNMLLNLLTLGTCLAVLFGLKLWTGGLILFVFLFDQFLNERPVSPFATTALPDVVYSLAMLVLLIAAGRYVGLTGHLVPYDGSITMIVWNRLQALRSRFLNDQGGRSENDEPLSIEAAPDDGMRPRDVSTFRTAELLNGLLRAIIAVIIALMLLFLVPVSRDAFSTTGLPPLVLRSITLAIVLSLIYFVSGGLLSALSWRTLGPRPARVYLRSVMARWYHREVRAAVVRQVKDRQRRRSQETGES